jgi:hypothetical protein
MMKVCDRCMESIMEHTYISMQWEKAVGMNREIDEMNYAYLPTVM